MTAVYTTETPTPAPTEGLKEITTDNTTNGLITVSPFFKKAIIPTKIKAVVYPNSKEDYSCDNDETLLIHCLPTKFTTSFFILVQPHEHILEVYADYIQKNHETCFLGTGADYNNFFFILRFENKLLSEEDIDEEMKKQQMIALQKKIEAEKK